MVSLEQKLSGGLDPTEDNFCRSALHYLSITSGASPKVEEWTVSPFDVEFLEKLGEGGL